MRANQRPQNDKGPSGIRVPASTPALGLSTPCGRSSDASRAIDGRWGASTSAAAPPAGWVSSQSRSCHGGSGPARTSTAGSEVGARSLPQSPPRLPNATEPPPRCRCRFVTAAPPPPDWGAPPDQPWHDRSPARCWAREPSSLCRVRLSLSLSLVLKSPRVPLPLRDARSFVCRSRALVLPSYVIASLHNFTQQPRLKTKSDRLSRLSTRSWPCPAVSTQPNPATTTSDRTRTSTRSSHKRQLQSHPRWLLRRQL